MNDGPIRRMLCNLSLFVLAPLAQAANPILPSTAFIPDGEPRVFEYRGEPRLFIYCSRDERVTDWCGYGHDVRSAPLDDFSEWTNHGEISNVKQVQEAGHGRVTASVDTTAELVSAALYYTVDPLSVNPKERIWRSLPAEVHANQIRADVPPAGSVVWFLTVKDERDVTVSGPLVFPGE